MKIDRKNFQTEVSNALAASPAVVLLGPRQVGKTTLARQIEQQTGAIYLDLERSADLRRIEDAGSFLASTSGKLTIIDEVHRAPHLFSELRGVIDDRRTEGSRFGQFLLLGSASLDLIQQSSESLAGRVAYMELLSIQVDEAASASIELVDLWQRGGFPDSVLASSDEQSFQWRLNFIRSYLERDVPMFAPSLSPALIARLWTMLANDQGNLLNASRLAKGLGISAPTVNRYLDLLIDFLLVRRLQPWSGNLNKRLVRSPKVYIRDSGLVHALLDIEDTHQLKGHSVSGNSWEGFVIENLISAAGQRKKPFFYRTADGAEIDLLFEVAGKPSIAIEVKLSSAPKIERGFYVACTDLAIKTKIVVAPVGASYLGNGGVQVLTLQDAINFLQG
jgi:uncharacterized protein